MPRRSRRWSRFSPHRAASPSTAMRSRSAAVAAGPSTTDSRSKENWVMTQANLEVIPVAGRIGAEIRGVRLAADLDARTVEAIRSAWLRHKVVFFRGQNHLDDRAQ